MRFLLALVATAVVDVGCSPSWDRPYAPARLAPDAARSPATRSPASAATVDDGDAVPLEDRRIFDEVNRVRAQWRLAPFRWNDRLHQAARDHSEDQRRAGRMGHGSPDPRKADLADRLRAARYGPATKWAEVVARGYEGPASVVTGWMNSRGHRTILTDPELEEAGFARVGEFFTGDFGTPRR